MFEIIYYINYCTNWRSLRRNFPRLYFVFISFQFQVYVIPFIYLFYKLKEFNILNSLNIFFSDSGDIIFLPIISILIYLGIYDYFTYFKKEKTEIIYKKYTGKFENLINGSFPLLNFISIAYFWILAILELIFRALI